MGAAPASGAPGELPAQRGVKYVDSEANVPMSGAHDWDLVARAQTGDMRAFADLFRHLDRLKPQAKFTTLLFGIARNLSLNHLRDTKRRGRGVTDSVESHPQLGDRTLSPDRAAQLHELQALIERGIARLSPKHREVLVLRELNGMDYESIARIVKCRQGTVKSRLARAREQLRQRLLELGGGQL